MLFACVLFSIFLANCGNIMLTLSHWQASVASKTLTGVTQLKIGDMSLNIYMCGRTSPGSGTLLFKCD